ncbi:MAG: 50S ribosomal protein L9 [Candidatus Marinimicrobia bacterium]|jgi:large subunit ribosomal protein L9|nr:50S ribosomal protein L9 [Candidatus Neomarinimicrobiota bacterium]
MKIILKENVEKLGDKNEIVNVKDGYARNYLFPKNLALKATKSNVNVIKELEKVKEKKEKSVIRTAQKLADKLKNISITVSTEAGEDEKIFGSVTTQKIAELLDEKGLKIDKHQIIIETPIKNLGVFNIPIKIHKEITAEVKLWVVKK